MSRTLYEFSLPPTTVPIGICARECVCVRIFSASTCQIKGSANVGGGDGARLYSTLSAFIFIKYIINI